jgi:hypothetical protein
MKAKNIHTNIWGIHADAHLPDFYFAGRHSGAR